MLEWTQQILRIGEAFSGAECTSLRDVLSRQSGKFFDAFHDANLQVLPSAALSAAMYESVTPCSGASCGVLYSQSPVGATCSDFPDVGSGHKHYIVVAVFVSVGVTPSVVSNVTVII